MPTGWGNEFDDDLPMERGNHNKAPQKIKSLEESFIKEGERKFYLDLEEPNNVAGVDVIESKNMVQDNKGEVIKQVVKEWEPWPSRSC